MDRLYGKYRAVVKETNDPENRGRIKVECPSVYGQGNLSNWCLPCFPFGFFAVPPKNSLVWIEFEEGSKNNPIWTGVFFTKTTFNDLYNTEGYDNKCMYLRAYKDIIIRCPSKVKVNSIKESGTTEVGYLTSEGKKVATE